VRIWFERTFPHGPTSPQAAAWPAIAARHDTLVAAPTGSGKTLSAFLVAIDRLYRTHDAGGDVSHRTSVVYVSPLKALAVDIAENLAAPLAGIASVSAELGLPAPDLRIGVRSGDTTASARASMVRRPPAFVVTTPESLYLMVTAEKSRTALATADTVIVDEIHTMARDKRGAHLALTLERLDHVTGAPCQRIGLSATQKPLDVVARLLVGAGRCTPGGDITCHVVDEGHERDLDLELDVPDEDLGALASNEQMGRMLDRIADLVTGHRTTLVFVNTRRMAERVAHQLAERLGEDAVCAHHGSLSKDRRALVEKRLRAGDLRALVATASLELGIDVGPVELVCQIGSPRSIATFLQRVGRSGHTRWGTPKGRLFPMTRDELVECTAVLRAVRGGRLDTLRPPVAPLDVLAQQIVAESACERWDVEDLYSLVRRAAPYANLDRAVWDEAIRFVSEGVTTGRGPRGRWVHHDAINGELAGRRGARLVALRSGGAIPDVADYRVVAEPDDTFIGTVNEDWAIESMAGDIFLLGTHSWRIRRVEAGVVRVVDAAGAPPTVPFWVGEAPARTAELSNEVSEVRRLVEHDLRSAGPAAARTRLRGECGIGESAAAMVVAHLEASLEILGALPTLDRLVLERFFDESGGMQLVAHSPRGARLNRALGLALRKKFCATFDFELQAAASDDAVVVSLGPQHSFPLADVPRFLNSRTAADVLRQAVLVPPSPMLTTRWRWNLNRALVVLRHRGSGRNPPALQRMQADDVMAAVFPGVAACQENVSGPVEVPDHLLVNETMHDTLHDAMDLDGLVEVLDRLENGTIEVVCRDTPEPSPLAHEILLGKPFTFLDDAPAEERRTRAVPLSRGLPVAPGDRGRPSVEAIDRVRSDAEPDPRTADELHDLLVATVTWPPTERWRPLFEELSSRSRAQTVPAPGGAVWVAAERVEGVLAGLHEPDRDETIVDRVGGHLALCGPVTVDQLARRTDLAKSTVAIGLAALEGRGAAVQGRFDPALEGPQWCDRRLLERIHVESRRRRRRSVEPASTRDFMRFVLDWHHLTPLRRLRGHPGLMVALEQLQGFHAPIGAWESSLLASRVGGLDPGLLDDVTVGGEAVWGRFDFRARPGGAAATRATPVTVALRGDAEWILRATRGDARPTEPDEGATAEVLDVMARRGASFVDDLAVQTGRLVTDVERALWDALARGLVTADSFAAARELVDGRRRRQTSRARPHQGLRRGATARSRPGGRWSLLPEPLPDAPADALAEAVAEQILDRWGVVARTLYDVESWTVPWRDVLWALRRLEDRGMVRGGRFVSGFTGEQFARPDAVDALNGVRRRPLDGTTVTVSASDPVNLTAVVTPEPRIASVERTMITFVDGIAEAKAVQ
jgi:ATP-dependent Lhr-like helicase